MKKLLFCIVMLLAMGLTLLSCGTSSSSSGGSTSGIKYRAFISNSASGAGSVAGIYIVDAATDVHPVLTPISAGNTPGMMVVTPNRSQTLIFSGNNGQFSDNQFSIINNAAESNATHLILPGYTESFVVSPNSATAYIAVPNAPVTGQSPGKIDVMTLSTGALIDEVDIPSVHFLAINNGGNRILAMSDVLSSLAAPCMDLTPSYLFVVTPSGIGVDPCPIVPVPGFDAPVQAFFSSDDSTAFVVNCGAECGGTQASVQQLDMTTNPPSLGKTNTPVCVPDSNNVKQCAASVAVLSGSTLYLAGTPYSGGQPSLSCTGGQGETLNCGMVTIMDLNSMSVTNTSPIVITDGYHNRIAMGSNGQLFVGARTCTEISQTSETRGCLSIVNTTGNAVGKVPAGGVLIPSANGDVTGIQPIATRTVVYVVQGGTLTAYDASTDGLATITNNPNHPGQIFNLVGNFADVKTVDF